MADNNDILVQAIAQMQETQQRLEAALEALLEHNIDLEAHPDLRDKIRELLQSPLVVTEDKVRTLVHEAVDAHEAKPYNEAHSGFEDRFNSLTEQFAEFQERLALLEARMQGREELESQTELQRQLQAIEDKWATVLNSLMTSYAEAEAQGSTAVMQEVQEAISQALDDKKAELLAALEEHTAG